MTPCSRGSERVTQITLKCQTHLRGAEGAPGGGFKVHGAPVPKHSDSVPSWQGSNRKQGRKDRKGGTKCPRAWNDLWPPESLSSCLSAAKARLSQDLHTLCKSNANSPSTGDPKVKELSVIPLFREAGQARVGRSQEADFSST